MCNFMMINVYIYIYTHSVTIMFVEDGNGHPSSNPRRNSAFHIALNTRGKGMHPTILPPAMNK